MYTINKPIHFSFLLFRTDEELGQIGLDCECLGGGRYVMDQ